MVLVHAAISQECVLEQYELVANQDVHFIRSKEIYLANDSCCYVFCMCVKLTEIGKSKCFLKFYNVNLLFFYNINPIVSCYSTS